MTPEILRRFVGRTDVFATQEPDGSYRPVRRPLTYADLEAHLAGEITIGSYTTVPPDRVRHLIFDLDTGSRDDLARLVTVTCDALGGVAIDPERALLVVDSGRKGWHLWVFLADYCPAPVLRRWAHRYILARLGDVEMFPKQDRVGEGYGNLIKLPYGVHRVTGRRAEPIPWAGLTDDPDEIEPLPVAVADRMAMVAPAAPARTPDSGPVELAGIRFPCVQRIVQADIPSGVRELSFYHVAAYWLTRGLPDDLVLEACRRINHRIDEPLNEGELAHAVRQASRRRGSCSPDWLRTFCPDGVSCRWRNRGGR